MNYSHIAAAVGFYQERGYVYLDDAPWHVGREAYYATKPSDAVDVALGSFNADIPVPLPLDRPYLVASGEQSFLQMMLDGQPIKRAICVTPCYRWEPRVDILHRRYFMKAELINAQDVDDGHLIDMVHDACSFFERMGISVRVLDTCKNPAHLQSYDIVEKGTRYELGSYGIRRMLLRGGKECFNWIYGTACAEPRLEIAKQKTLKSLGR